MRSRHQSLGLGVIGPPTKTFCSIKDNFGPRKIKNGFRSQLRMRKAIILTKIHSLKINLLGLIPAATEPPFHLVADNARAATRSRRRRLYSRKSEIFGISLVSFQRLMDNTFGSPFQLRSQQSEQRSMADSQGSIVWRR
ncbi:hypothetical protein PVK06_011810 [Gossypium arboreum]|uniref:Uncharacterized protein n=1 Tax=Gossypium arboreum TaxID=29729 RepID=A0ABR0QB09_GOSAR|nr:hypothetical protein PVK06_011810 [Gossypium arboreum]